MTGLLQAKSHPKSVDVQPRAGSSRLGPQGTSTPGKYRVRSALAPARRPPHSSTLATLRALAGGGRGAVYPLREPKGEAFAPLSQCYSPNQRLRFLSLSAAGTPMMHPPPGGGGKAATLDPTRWGAALEPRGALGCGSDVAGARMVQRGSAADCPSIDDDAPWQGRRAWCTSREFRAPRPCGLTASCLTAT